MSAIDRIKELYSFSVNGGGQYVSLKDVLFILEDEGEWDEVYDKNEPIFFQRKFVCSKCGVGNSYGRTDYCPYCGSKMRVEKHD